MDGRLGFYDILNTQMAKFLCEANGVHKINYSFRMNIIGEI